MYTILYMYSKLKQNFSQRSSKVLFSEKEDYSLQI